jgi:hypothetical protein
MAEAHINWIGREHLKRGCLKEAIVEHLPVEVRDGTLIAAILESDDIVHAIQRKLRILYPELTVPSSSIRHILREKVLCQDVLNNERLSSAQARLAAVTTAPADKRRKSARAAWLSIARSEREESLWDILRYDMTYASCGG